VSSPFETPVIWFRSEDVEPQWVARVDGREWLLRLGDFPAEPLYTLLIDGAEVESFDAWPEAWIRSTGSVD
jgi:hypothetical protein